MQVQRRTIRTALAAALTLGTLSGAAMAGAPASAAPAYAVKPLHFAVTVGPNLDQACDVVGDLYVPSTASAAHRVPSILTTNGFGGSAADQGPFAQKYAADGYVVLSYSGLGFGGSGCKITLDDPDYDGVAARALVSFLGGAPNIAFTDAQHTTPAPVLDMVVHDATNHRGSPRGYDPRVGMWGGSYGGQIQFAAASVDARIDALNPQITWNDLSYSLGPNNITKPGSVTVANPGATKITWGALFSTVGIADGAEYAGADPTRLAGCPNFADFVCPALVTAGTTGYFQTDAIAKLRHASVHNYLSKINIPVLLDQGQTDTLFNLNEAVATYEALKAQGTTVKMLWREQGHSGGKPTAAGYTYEAGRIKAWFDHYLKGSAVGTGRDFAYYRDYTGTFAGTDTFPVSSSQTYYLSTSRRLAHTASNVRAGSSQFTTVPGGAPSGIGNPDAIGGYAPAGTPIDQPDQKTPGTYVYWQTTPLTHNTDVVGAPRLTVRIEAPTAVATSAAGPGGQVVLFAKIYDVPTSGSPTLVKSLVAPVRIADPTKAFQVVLPAFVHRFAPGHRIRLDLAGGDLNYRGGAVATPVTVTTGSPAQSLTLPVVP